MNRPYHRRLLMQQTVRTGHPNCWCDARGCPERAPRENGAKAAPPMSSAGSIFHSGDTKTDVFNLGAFLRTTTYFDRLEKRRQFVRMVEQLGAHSAESDEKGCCCRRNDRANRTG